MFKLINPSFQVTTGIIIIIVHNFCYHYKCYNLILLRSVNIIDRFYDKICVCVVVVVVV